MITPERQLQSVARKLAELQSAKFYGKLVVHFEAGNITLLRSEQTIRPEELLDEGEVLPRAGN